MSAGLIVMHPQGMAIIADSRKMRGCEIVSDRSRKVFVFERVVVLHVGYAGLEGELEALMFRLEIRAKEWDAQSLAWKLLEEAEQIWGERLGKTEPVLFFVCDVVERVKRCYRVEVSQHERSVEGWTMKYERMVKTVAVGDETFQNLVMQTRLMEGAADLHEVVRRGRFAVEEAGRWVEMRDGWTSFGGECQTAVILNTGTVIYPAG
ncbi:hypothetical protein [Anaerolinea sp.]|uniref:hypothetical protein n=1 Tax=Anaerolinea sp. TaxID=1872519 RepID=UPI002ACE06ED|nr:hypothetical protein [Anaerolinea sp.]